MTPPSGETHPPENPIVVHPSSAGQGTNARKPQDESPPHAGVLRPGWPKLGLSGSRSAQPARRTPSSPAPVPTV